jgi:X box-binding protein 1
MTLVAPKTIVLSSAQLEDLQDGQIFSSGIAPNRLEEILESAGPRKRKRLNHLTPEERMLRRKLKNRVAAQTARDRKKAQMSDLEELVTRLEQENQRLQQENSTLRQVTGSLTKENVSLKERLGMGPTEAECVSESAVLSSTPLPKEKAHILLLWLTHWLALLMTSKTNSSVSSSKCPKRLLSLMSNPRLQNQLLRLMSRSKERSPWWGPQQKSWNPSMN